jgi:hypothetical protein
MPSVSKAQPAPATNDTPDAATLSALTERLFTANREATDVATEIAKEMMEFTSRRLRAQMEFVSEMPQMGDVNGVMAAQLRFLERASRDYAQELGTVSQVLLRAAANGNGQAKAN